MPTREERRDKNHHLFEAKYGVPIEKGEFNGIFSRYRISEYLLFQLWILMFILAYLSMAFYGYTYYGYLFFLPLMMFGCYAPISLGAKFSPGKIYDRIIIHSCLNLSFLLFGGLGIPYSNLYMSSPIPFFLLMTIVLLAVGTTIIDLLFYDIYNRFIKLVKTRGQELKEEAKTREIEPLFAVIDAFLAHPQVDEGAELLAKIKIVIIDCRSSSYEQLAGKLAEKLQVVTTKYQALVKVCDNLANAEQLLAKGNIGQASAILHDSHLLPSIKDLDLPEHREKYMNLLPRLQIAMKLSQEHIMALISQALAAKDGGNFEEARKNLEEANVEYLQLTPQSHLHQSFSFDYPQHLRGIEVAEHETKIYRAIVEYARKYSRIHISELITAVQLPGAEIEPVLKKLISTGKIRATFDEQSKGIEFHFLVEEIDQLLKGFADWEGRKGGKKSS